MTRTPALTLGQRKAWLRKVYVGKKVGIEGGRRLLCTALITHIKPDYPMSYTVSVCPTDLDPSTEEIVFGPQGLTQRGAGTLAMVPYSEPFKKRLRRMVRTDYRKAISQTVLQGRHTLGTLKRILSNLNSAKQIPIPTPKAVQKKIKDWPRLPKAEEDSVE